MLSRLRQRRDSVFEDLRGDLHWTDLAALNTRSLRQAGQSALGRLAQRDLRVMDPGRVGRTDGSPALGRDEAALQVRDDRGQAGGTKRSAAGFRNPAPRLSHRDAAPMD